jgi:hypothetical protein
MLSYIVHKRKSFEHERELRAVIYAGINGVPFASPGGMGLVVPINIAALIEEIVVSPTSQPPLSEVVAGLASKYGLAAPVRQSDVNDGPAY